MKSLITVFVGCVMLLSCSGTTEHTTDEPQGTVIIDFKAEVMQTYRLRWAFPDTCYYNRDIAEFIVWFGKHSWKDSLTEIVLYDSVHTGSSDDEYSVGIPRDTTLLTGGYQHFFAVQAVDSAGNVSAMSDTITVIYSYDGDIWQDKNDTSWVDGADYNWFMRSYSENYKKPFVILRPAKRDSVIILYLE